MAVGVSALRPRVGEGSLRISSPTLLSTGSVRALEKVSRTRAGDARSRSRGWSRVLIRLLRGTETAKQYTILVACDEGRPIDMAVASGGRVRWGNGQ